MDYKKLLRSLCLCKSAHQDVASTVDSERLPENLYPGEGIVNQISPPSISIPHDFDENVYLELNPDLEGVDLVTHYINHGIAESRSYKFDLPKNFDPILYKILNPDLCGDNLKLKMHYHVHGKIEGRTFEIDSIASNKFNSNFKDVLLVVHEASRTGAPILGLALLKELSIDFNVTVLLLGGGALKQQFIKYGAVYDFSSYRYNKETLSKLIKYLFNENKFNFCILNSVETAMLLNTVSFCSNNNLILVHEFQTCYPSPKILYNELLDFDGIIVFSSERILSDARKLNRHFKSNSVHVLPQPKLDTQEFISNGSKKTQIQYANKKNKLKVMGAGSVSYRKGVDIFITIASALNRLHPNMYEFEWIGGGYLPETDALYSVYLKEQVEASKLTDVFKFVGEVENFDEVVSTADVFLMTSRLDPLPNVVIDAITNGVPVFYFKGTSGYDEIFSTSKIYHKFAAEYLDISGIVSLISTSNHSLCEIIENQKSNISKLGDCKQYINRLMKLMQSI